MSQTNLKWIIIALSLVAGAAISLAAYLLWPKAVLEPAPVAEKDAATTISETIQTFDPSDPTSFFAIQDIVDLGDGVIEPLVSLAASDDLVDQWTAVVALGSIRRTTDDQTKISETMQQLYESQYESIRIYAAASTAEFDDFSGVEILIEALTSDTIMTYMEPPTPTATFANRVLEFASGQDVGFDETATPEAKQAAIAAWQAWAQTK